MAVEIGRLSDEIVKELQTYTLYVAQEVKQASDDVAKDLLKNIRREAPKRRGKGGGTYRRAMAIKVTKETTYEKRNVWYVKAPQYRLTHLLENGHRKRNSGFTKAYPHVKDKEQAAKEIFEARVREIIKYGL